MNRAGRLFDHPPVGVFQKLRQLRRGQPAQRHHAHEPHVDRGVGALRHQLLRRRASHQTHHRGMAQHGHIRLFRRKREQRLDRRGFAQFPQRDRRLQPHPRLRIGQQRNQALRLGFRARDITKNFYGLRANLAVRIREQRHDGRERCGLAPQQLTHAPDRVHAGESRGRSILGDSEQQLAPTALGELELRPLAHALIAVAKQRHERVIGRGGKARAQETMRFKTNRVRGSGRRIDAPDRPEAVERITSDPIRQEQRTIGMPSETDAHHAFVDDARIDHLKRRPVALGAKTAQFPGRKFVEKKHPALRRTQRRARVIAETRRSVGIIRNRRQQISRLTRKERLPQALAHPRARLGHVLVIAAPTGVAALHDIGETLALALHVGVVVHHDEIAEIIERRLLRIAHPAGVDFEVRAVGLDPEDRAFVGIVKILPLLRGHVGTLVADAPINPPVGPDTQAVHVVSRVGEVNAEPVRDDFADVGDAIIVSVLEPPKIGRDRRVDPAIVIHHAGGDAGGFGVKPLGEDGHFVRRAIAVGVAELINALGERGEILPIDGAVAVVILEPTARCAQFSRRQFFAEKRAFVRDARQADIARDPHPVLPDVEVGHLAPRRRRHVDAALRIDSDRDGVGDVQRTRPFLKDESRFFSRALGCAERAQDRSENHRDHRPQDEQRGETHGIRGTQTAKPPAGDAS